MRSMSMTGAQGRKGPTGDASGIVGGDGMALSGGFNAAAIAERAAYLDAPTEGDLTFTYNNGESSYSVPVPNAWFMAGWDFVFFLNDILGGSNGGSGPTYRQQLMELRATQGGRHPLYTQINGISNTLIVDQNSSAPDPMAHPGTPGSSFSFVLPPLSKEPNHQLALCQELAWLDFWHEIRIISVSSAAIFTGGAALCAGGDVLTGGRLPLGRCVESVAGATLRAFAATTEVAAYALLIDLENCKKRYPLTS
jgi:hypothetical protein